MNDEYGFVATCPVCGKRYGGSECPECGNPTDYSENDSIELSFRGVVAFLMFVVGFVLLIGTFGEYEFAGFMEASEFKVKIFTGLGLLLASIPMSGYIREERVD